MHVQTKLDLMKYTDSYWDLLPPELKELILKYKESQELIEWRERRINRRLCEQIEMYGQLRRQWILGPIRCQCKRTRVCGNVIYDMEVSGHYWDLNGTKQRLFLGHSLEIALLRCDSLKLGLWYQTNPQHCLLLFLSDR